MSSLGMSGEAPTFTFSSLDAHNRCRGLFNGTNGWTFITPPGAIDTEAFPLVIPERRYDKGCRKAPGAAAPSAVKRYESTRRPGDKIIRKMTERRWIKSACIYTKEVERLVHEVNRSNAPVFEAGNMGENWETEGGKREGERGICRTGQPIVLTLQAILAATSKTDSTVATNNFMTDSTVDRDQCSNFEAMCSRKEGLEGGGSLNLEGQVGVPQVADPANFPPLVMRGAPSEVNGLYLSPPIMMVKRPSEDKGEEIGQGGICSSEVDETTRISESVKADVPRAVEGMSRVGWWLRWTGSVVDGETLVDPEMKDQGQIDCFEAGKAFNEGGWEILPVDTSETDGGAWALVDTEKCEAHGRVGSDADVALCGYENGAESWCDCSSNLSEVDVYEMLNGLPPVSLSEEDAMKEISRPLSYRDMLMTPTPAGVIPLTKSSWLGMCDQGMGFDSSLRPAVVDCDTQGSMVSGWREAETVEDWGLFGEVEDPYYARKRLGAFAHRTKPRGREHK